jgi:hypothetical protein
MTAERMTAQQVRQALFHHFADRWAVLTEVRAAQDGRVYRDRERRIDVLLIRRARGGTDTERMALEIKVSRADFLADVRDPTKQAPWRALTHRHAYVVPTGLVLLTEVPEGSGLLTVHRSEHTMSGFAVKTARPARRPEGHQPGPLPLPIVMDAFWRAARAEAQLKGYAREHSNDVAADGDEEALRAEVGRLRHQVELAEGRNERLVEQRDRWRALFTVHGDPPCGTCGKPLSPTRRASSYTSWEHRDPAASEACKGLRRAAAIAQRYANPDDAAKYELGLAPDDYVHVPGPEPAELDEGDIRAG